MVQNKEQGNRDQANRDQAHRDPASRDQNNRDHSPQKQVSASTATNTAPPTANSSGPAVGHSLRDILPSDVMRLLVFTVGIGVSLNVLPFIHDGPVFAAITLLLLSFLSAVWVVIRRQTRNESAYKSKPGGPSLSRKIRVFSVFCLISAFALLFFHAYRLFSSQILNAPLS
ncbi:hypothetical protein [Kiloniella laminariae]|uniref:hypothetical protein n=1 Tax=Kiloniella laminariae TaxID=454162 RepID=UPI0003697A8C|nr:hypothetical protein [Kiloniella laminariae]